MSITPTKTSTRAQVDTYSKAAMHRGARIGACRRAMLCVALVMAMVAVCVGLPVGQAYAYGPIGPSRTGSLTVAYRDDGVPITGASIEVRRVGNVSTTGVLTFTDTYAAYGISLNIEDAAGWRAAAQTLAGYVSRDSIAADAVASTNASGEAHFADLVPGLYLVTSAAHEQNGIRYTAEPAFVMIPQLNEYDEWVYDAQVVLKFTEEELPPKPMGDDLKVVKLWLDDQESDRPASVTVQLLRDGAVFDTQVLSGLNGWVYVWRDLDPSYTWAVVEADVPDGYTTVVHREEDIFVIENTLEADEPEVPGGPTDPENPGEPSDPDDPDSPENPTEPSEPDDKPSGPWTPVDMLPQTGVSHGTIILFAALGMALLAVGWFLTRRGRSGER